MVRLDVTVSASHACRAARAETARLAFGRPALLL